MRLGSSGLQNEVERMKSRRGFLAAGLILIGGCKKNRFTQENLDRARAAVESGLTSWQKGEAPQVLASRPDPVQFFDDLWTSGNRLVSFQIKDTVGDNQDVIIRCSVALTLKDKKGRTSEREVTYQVTLKSPVVVARDPYF